MLLPVKVWMRWVQPHIWKSKHQLSSDTQWPCTGSPSSNIIKGGSGWSEGGGARNIHTSVLHAPCLEGCTIALFNRSTMHVYLHSAVLWILWFILNICQHWRGFEESFSCRTKVKGVEAVVICMTKNCNFFQFLVQCCDVNAYCPSS